jgi:hypothetical protein
VEGGGDVVRDIAFKRKREEDMFPAMMVPRLLQEKVKRWEVQKVRRRMTNGLSGHERVTQVVQQFTQLTHCACRLQRSTGQRGSRNKCILSLIHML